MTSNEIKALTGRYIMNTYGRFPVAIERGEGARLYDFEGREYIDFTSGIGVCDLGYGNAIWADAVAEQAKKLNHVSNLFYTEPAARLAEILCRRTGMSNVFFANGGVERVHILDGRIPHSILIELLSDRGIGTMLKREAD